MSAYQGENDATKGAFGRSAALWEGVNWQQLMFDPSYGRAVVERFLPYRSGDYTVTQATAGSQTQYASADGGVVIDAGSTTANQGANVQHKTPWLPGTSGLLIYETIGFLSANGTGPQFFVGLHEDDTTILTTSGALTSDELIGFHSTGSNTLLAKNHATGTIQSQAAGSLSTSGAVIRLGFKVYRRSKIEFYVDGNLLATTPISQIPSTAMLYPSVVVRSNGTTQPTFTQYEWACAQIYQSNY